VAVFVAVVVIAGCGQDPAGVAVRGQVRLDGEPLAAGSIEFIPEGPAAGPLAAAEIRDGRYTLGADDGPVCGALRVRIWGQSYLAFELDDPLQYADQSDVDLGANLVPSRYNHHTVIVVEAAAGQENEFNFDLTSS
jgi:hypothetical protein